MNRSMKANNVRRGEAVTRIEGARSTSSMTLGTTIRSSLLSLALASLAACGDGFSNEPFQTGAVEGHFDGEIGGATEVFVFGSPELRAQVAADGSYRLENVPVGSFELLAIDPAGRATRFPIEIRPGAITRPESRPLPPAGLTRVAIDSVGYANMAGARVSIEGTHLETIAQEGGTASLGPLPGGCYTMRVERAGHRPERASSCRSQIEELQVAVTLMIDEEAEAPGCAVSGCSHSLTCDEETGRCFACRGDADCAMGLSCVEGLCEIPAGAPAPGCAACETDVQCGLGARCDIFSPLGEIASRYCSFPTGCTVNADCPFGTRCEDGLCREDDRKFAQCGASSSLGASCPSATSSECRDHGLLTGVCSGMVCTMECDGVNAICPAGWSCRDSLCEQD